MIQGIMQYSPHVFHFGPEIFTVKHVFWIYIVVKKKKKVAFYLTILKHNMLTADGHTELKLNTYRSRGVLCL